MNHSQGPRPPGLVAGTSPSFPGRRARQITLGVQPPRGTAQAPFHFGIGASLPVDHNKPNRVSTVLIVKKVLFNVLLWGLIRVLGAST